MASKVVGFILGDASGWEYGVPANIGWIDTIGVDPAYQKKGVARILIQEMLNYMKEDATVRKNTLLRKAYINTILLSLRWI